MPQACKILVVDDEPLLKSLLFQKFRAQINSKELEFHFASNGIEALEKLNNDHEIGVILTDIKMPKMDGLTLIHQIAEHDRLYKIIVISAYGDMNNIRKAMDGGASDFIIKPFNLVDLESSLLNMVEQFQFIKKGALAKDKMLELSKEIEIAKKIKKSFIPVDFKTIPADRYSLCGAMIPSQELGGNFFDFFPLNEDEMGIVVINVFGKGISAALYTAIVQMLGRAIGLTCNQPSDFTTELHHFLIKEVPSKVITGVFYGVFNTLNGEFNFCNEGEVIAYLLSHDKKLINLHECKQMVLKKNDKIFIATSELLNAKNEKKEAYGKRIDEVLNECLDKPCDELIQKVKENFNLFMGSSLPEEDIPIFCLEARFS